FDRAMAPQHYSFVRTDEGVFPECAGPPQLSADQRTYSRESTAKPPGKHVVYFNKPPYTAFRDAATGTPAGAARLEFTVRDDRAAGHPVLRPRRRMDAGFLRLDSGLGLALEVAARVAQRV